MDFIYIALFIVFIFFSRAIFVGIKTGVFGSAYGEQMTVRKSEGVIGFYLWLSMHILVWIWMAYLLFTRASIFF
jgi:hypothetical protein